MFRFFRLVGFIVGWLFMLCVLFLIMAQVWDTAMLGWEGNIDIFTLLIMF